MPELEEDAVELYETAPCGYLSTTPGGTIVKVNQTFLDWTGFTREDLVGRRRFQDLLTVGGRIYYETHFAPLLRMQGFINEVALDLQCAAGGRLPVFANSVQKLDAAGSVALVRTTVFNASDRRRYERELLEARRAAEQARAELLALTNTLEQRVAEEIAERLKAEEALRQAQKMEAIGQLTGGVAHDFNNLLTVIIGGLDTIERQLAGFPEGPSLERVRRGRDMAMEGARRATALTKRLLAFSRRQALEPTVLDLNRLVTGLTDLLRRTLGETVQLETVLSEGLWSCRADHNQLENAVVNLAVNARDAMAEGGRLTIETANAHLDDRSVKALAEPVPPGDYVILAVTDTGTGMSEDTLKRVFEPFFTTKEAGKGTGLGLSQVYGFVRQSGGHVRICSEPGRGTTVRIYLPRTTETVDAVAAAPFEIETLPRGDETILMVEDQADLRAYAAGVLRDLGYRVIEAKDGAEAVALAHAHSRIALLFTDIVLPGRMNGRQLADAVARHNPGLKVLYTSGYASSTIADGDGLHHEVDLLEKPFTYAEVAQRVRRALDQT